MSSEIWKIGQETNAQTIYDNINEKGIGGTGVFRIRGEVIAVKILTGICNQMSEAYDEVIEDQNEYLVDIEADASKFEDLQQDINEKIKQLYKEIKELEKKEKDGSITPEEQDELEAKKGELSALTKDADSMVKEQSDSAKAKSEERIKAHKSKETIAQNFGEVTVEKGTPLAETEVSSGFFRKLFGTTGKDKKEAGEKAVEAGENLLNKVDISKDISENINKSYKKFNVK